LSYWRFPLLLIVLLALAAGLAACGEGSSDDPQGVLDSASLEGVSSGRFEASLAVESKGKGGEELNATASGQFQKGSKDRPQFAVNTEIKGSVQGTGIDFTGGLTLLSDYGFVNYQGVDYEIDSGNFATAKSIFVPDQGEGKKATNDETACDPASMGLRISDLVENPRDAGTAQVDGTKTTKISGELDLAAFQSAIDELTRNPQCQPQLEAILPASLPGLRQVSEDFAAAVKRAPGEVYIDENGVVRKFEAELSTNPKATGGEEIVANLEFSLSEVNEPQQIEVPAKAKPITALFGKLAINPVEFVSLPNGGTVVAYLLRQIYADAVS
jgi:hypothetical protein